MLEMTSENRKQSLFVCYDYFIRTLVVPLQIEGTLIPFHKYQQDSSILLDLFHIEIRDASKGGLCFALDHIDVFAEYALPEKHNDCLEWTRHYD